MNVHNWKIPLSAFHNFQRIHVFVWIPENRYMTGVSTQIIWNFDYFSQLKSLNVQNNIACYIHHSNTTEISIASAS